MSAPRRLCAIAALLLVASCSRGGWTRAACEPARPHEPGLVPMALASGGLDRTAILYVPDGYDGDREYPVVFSWHGFGSNAGEHIKYADMFDLADSEDFFVIAPNGTGTPPRFNLESGITSDADDVQFALDLIDALGREYCVDAGRVYSTGVSNGAGMSALLACRAPDRVAAVGIVALLRIDAQCRDTPVPVLAIQGDADLVVPIQGGEVNCCGGWAIPPAAETAAAWAAHNRCEETGDTKEITEHVERTIWDHCASDVEVRYYLVHGGGHTWPGEEGVGPLGPTTGEISASEEMWDFFKRFSLPRDAA